MEGILIKFGIKDKHINLLVEFSHGAYKSVISPISPELGIECDDSLYKSGKANFTFHKQLNV
jgi:hypothetical protein